MTSLLPFFLPLSLNLAATSAGFRSLLCVCLQHDLHGHASPGLGDLRQGRGRADVPQVCQAVHSRPEEPVFHAGKVRAVGHSRDFDVTRAVRRHHG